VTEVSIFVFCSEYRSPVFQYSNIPSLHFLVDSYPLKRVEAKLGISSKEDAIAPKNGTIDVDVMPSRHSWI
jgi:hypothetical protein